MSITSFTAEGPPIVDCAFPSLTTLSPLTARNNRGGGDAFSWLGRPVIFAPAKAPHPVYGYSFTLNEVIQAFRATEYAERPLCGVHTGCCGEGLARGVHTYNWIPGVEVNRRCKGDAVLKKGLTVGGTVL